MFTQSLANKVLIKSFSQIPSIRLTKSLSTPGLLRVFFLPEKNVILSNACMCLSIDMITLLELS